MDDIEFTPTKQALEWEGKFVTPYAPARKASLVKLFEQQLRELEAFKASHAAEMRELKERFGLAALLVDGDLEALGFAKTSPTRSLLAPFIIPDPLVEALQQAYDAAVAELGEDYVRKLSWFPSARKIGEAGE